MAEIVKNQDVMKTIEEEMKREIGSNKIKVSQLSKLPYLQACVKESLRLHPPVPFLLPRLAVEICEVTNYTIPKNAQIFVNVWAIGRDPNVWDDPLLFKPERFLGSDLDFKGQDFELLPFGSGRRICPSLPLGSKSMEFIIASLVHEFDWVLPDNEDPSQLDMEERFQITLGREKPLKLIFKQKQGSAEV
ncbi:putative geraniol 8-hydroxylase [Helianthus annuus]|uniref:Geraniol 8-hydroxylase n=2 Tax=Helianthus annuus TaxID=4232 RepID=A0A9K3EFZ5_HELAN|nr:putative geraniol 8-hydroxylase [Helianthus annuus]KAJ0476004.1 putative geraniol 8-hydroxylase [Helianthus annuus]KAJ0496808.1 putative geraniol 8-hydroxylase [Helianthus annuus]